MDRLGRLHCCVRTQLVDDILTSAALNHRKEVRRRFSIRPVRLGVVQDAAGVIKLANHLLNCSARHNPT